MSQISALRARATELGITFDQRWGENKLKAAIAAEEEAQGISPEPESDPSVEQDQPEGAEQADPDQETEQAIEPAQELEQSEEADTGATIEPDAQQEPTQAEVVAEPGFDAESLSVKNISKNPMTIGFVIKAKPGFTVTLTGNQLTDKLRKKIAYGVKLGLLELV